MSGNLWCDISDHLPNYVIVSNPKKNKPSCERPLTRIYSDKNMKTFQHLISSTVWDDIYNCQDVDESYKVFQAKLKTCCDESFPLIRVSRRCARNKRWITPGIIVCSKKKNKLYKKWITSKKDSDGLEYKSYRKIFESVE